MDTGKIKVIIIGIIATFVALYLGISAATAQFETIAWVLGSGGLIICLALGRKIWLLIPFMSALSISLRIPGQPDSALVGQMVVLGFSIPLFLMRKLPIQLAWREMDLWLLLLTLFVFQVYVRHPVGLNILGGGSVGGKPYIIYAICLVSGLLLAALRVPASDLKWLLRLSILGGLLNLAFSVLGALVPTIGYYTGGSYTRSDETNYEAYGKVADTGAATRISYLGVLGRNLSLWISAYVSPLRACLHPLWGGLILITVIATLMSGFRNNFVAVGLTFMCAIAYRSGFSGVNLSLFGAVCGVAMLAAINMVHPLPPNIQRSLTLLPGTWEQRYIDDAQYSSKWRMDIWREALASDRWIENKWLGDGLGFKASELASQLTAHAAARTGISGLNDHQETILKNGDYHSGPVQTIRTIGYMGLMFLLIAQFRLAVHAHRQIQRCKNTEWFPLALLIGIPLIWAPLFFIFIFGTFSTGTAGLFLGYGLIRLLENNLPLPAYVMRGRVPLALHTRQLLAGSAASNR